MFLCLRHRLPQPSEIADARPVAITDFSPHADFLSLSSQVRARAKYENLIVSKAKVLIP